MIDGIPEWLAGLVDSFVCPACKKNMSDKGIIGLGIRNSYMDPDNTVLYIAYECQNCSDKKNIEIQPCTLEDLAFMLLEYIDPQEDRDLSQPNQEGIEEEELIETPKVEKSKISSKEIKSIKHKLDIVSADELNRNLGIYIDDGK